jgi:hypothetical protein
MEQLLPPLSSEAWRAQGRSAKKILARSKKSNPRIWMVMTEDWKAQIARDKFALLRIGIAEKLQGDVPRFNSRPSPTLHP